MSFLKTKLKSNPCQEQHQIHGSECQVIICRTWYKYPYQVSSGQISKCSIVTITLSLKWTRVLKQNSLWQWLRKSLYLLCTHEDGLALGLLKKTKVSLVEFFFKNGLWGLLEIWKSPYQQEAFQKLTKFSKFLQIEDARSTGCYT